MNREGVKRMIFCFQLSRYLLRNMKIVIIPDIYQRVHFLIESKHFCGERVAYPGIFVSAAFLAPRSR